MRILKAAAVAIMGLLLVVMGLAAILPKTYSVKRQITIQSSADKVYPWLVDFRNFHDWQPWRGQDPDAKYEIIGNPGQAGSTYSWSGKKVGTGQLKIVNTVTNKRVESYLVITEPQQMASSDILEINDKGANEVEVIWINSGELNYPVGRLFGLILDKMLGADYDRGLQQLKSKVESGAVPAPAQ
jgi:hypothetical protein